MAVDTSLIIDAGASVALVGAAAYSVAVGVIVWRWLKEVIDGGSSEPLDDEAFEAAGGGDVYKCADCGWIGYDPRTITAEEIADDPDLSPEDRAQALQDSVAAEVCPECTSPALDYLG